MTELTNIGDQMSNVMFNLARRAGKPLEARDCDIMDKLYKKWDAARRATVACDKPPSSECALPPLPDAAFWRVGVEGEWLASTSREVCSREREAYEDAFSDDPDMRHEEPEALYTAEQVEQIRREAVEADRRARESSGNALNDVLPIEHGAVTDYGSPVDKSASAAQGVKTWRERCDWTSSRPAAALMVEAMNAEIAELRDRLARQSQEPQAERVELVELLKAIRPGYGAVGSRDVDVAAQQKRIDRAVELLAAAPAHPVAQPADPMDWPLPCDVKVGTANIRQGCKLRTLVTRMESLHRMAIKAFPEPTPEARALVDSMIAGTWKPEDGVQPAQASAQDSAEGEKE